MSDEVYKGILSKGRKKHPIQLIEVVSVYRTMMEMRRASCEIVAAQLTSMGYLSKSGGPVNRNQVFRAMSNSPDGMALLDKTRKLIGRPSMGRGSQSAIAAARGLRREDVDERANK